MEQTSDSLKRCSSHWWVAGSSCSEGLRVCSEHFTHISTAVVLVDQSECDAGLEGPGQQGIELSLHDDEKQGQMSLFTHSIPIQICTDTHFVSHTRVGERRAVN